MWKLARYCLHYVEGVIIRNSDTQISGFGGNFTVLGFEQSRGRHDARYATTAAVRWLRDSVCVFTRCSDGLHYKNDKILLSAL
jgi:hypothetical protein